MVKKYTYIKIEREAKKALDQRLARINNVDLKRMGVKKGKIPQVEFTKFLFQNPIFISDRELKQLIQQNPKKFKGAIC